MAAYRPVYNSRHLQADCQEPGSAPEPYARYVIEYGLPLPFYIIDIRLYFLSGAVSWWISLSIQRCRLESVLPHVESFEDTPDGERKCAGIYNKWHNIFFSYTAISILVISNHNGFRVLFDKIASVYFIWKIY